MASTGAKSSEKDPGECMHGRRGKGRGDDDGMEERGEWREGEKGKARSYGGGLKEGLKKG